MLTSDYVEALLEDLTTISSIGAEDDNVAAAARRLSRALAASAGQRLLDVLADVALELSAQLPVGHVELRVRGRDPELVYVDEERAAAARGGSDDEMTARITLRLPEALKSEIEGAAGRAGTSVNAWIVRALGRGVSIRTSHGKRLRGYARS